MGRSMRTRVLLLFPMLLFFLLLSCGPSPSLVVVVQDRLTGEPLEGAECRLPEVWSRSDTSGRCRFDEWSSADVVRVVAAGYQPEQAGLAGLPSSGEPPEATATVALWPDRFTGLVMDDYAGEAVGEAHVRALGRTVMADAEGQFTVMSPTFPLELAVEAPGYEGWAGSFSATTGQVALRPNTLKGMVVDRYDGRPIAGAAVTLTGSVRLTTTTGVDGRYRLEGVPERFTVAAGAPLYRPASVDVERKTGQDLQLRPAFLHGLVRDARDGGVVPLARVVWAGGWVHTDDQGRFFLEDVPEGIVLQVLSPGFAKQVVTVSESSSVTVDLTPFAVQGIYVTSYVISTFDGDPTTTDWFTSLLDFVEETELNAMVLEVKDAWGVVAYNSQLPLVQEVREIALEDANFAGRSYIRYDVEEILRQCRERGIYTIAYIVAFEDSWLTLGDAHPEWAIQSAARGAPWTDRKGLRWTDPYRLDVWEYNVGIAKELALLGFDEIQFDYIRFPTDGDTTDVVYAEETDIEKQYNTIAGFVQYAYEELAPTGVFVSADVFGYAAWRKMWEQGQDISLMTHYLDFLCPMSYPSHYSPGEQGCANPNACPYIIVLETMKRAHEQMAGGQRAILRPWLQDFDLGSPPYGPTEVEEQILAAQDGGAFGWCLWNAGNVYTDEVDYSP